MSTKAVSDLVVSSISIAYTHMWQEVMVVVVVVGGGGGGGGVEGRSSKEKDGTFNTLAPRHNTLH